jgi:hypothetical protein
VLCVALAAGSLVLAVLTGRALGEILVNESILTIAILTTAFSVAGPLIASHRPEDMYRVDLLCRRIRAVIDRRFYRQRDDAGKMLEAFSAKLRDETILYRLGKELV